MALINRLSRLFTADVHAVLDRIEEPDVLLRHAIREMEDELAAAEQAQAALEHEQTTLGERQRKLEASLVELDSQLAVAFEAGNEELARRLVRRKLETDKLGRHAVERQAALRQDLDARRAKLTERREQLDVMRQKAELFATRPISAPGDDWTQGELTVGEDEVEIAFLRERQKRRAS